jgi:hypothetical protein
MVELSHERSEKREKFSFNFWTQIRPDGSRKNRQKVVMERRCKDGESLGRIRMRKGIFVKQEGFPKPP